MILVTLGLLVILAVLVWLYSRWCHSYWQKRGVPVAPGFIPIFGHTMKFFSKTEFMWEFMDKVYKHHGGSTFCGLYEQFTPNIVIGDPDLIKHVLIRDFDHFVDRRNFNFTGSVDETLQDIMTNATGSHWKGIRSVVSPSFTSGRIKGMFPLVLQKADGLVQCIHKKVTNEKPEIELKNTFGKYSLEVIASCAFGLETNLMEDESSEFALKVAQLFKFKVTQLVKGLIYLTFPKICQALKFNLSQKEIPYFRDVVLQSMKQRDAGLYRADFLDLMMKAREEQKDPDSKAPKYPLKDNTIVAQSILFIFAGYDTTSTSLSFVTFLLAKYPEVQRRLREEIKELVNEHGELNYQGIMESKYFDACISETLRLYGSATLTERQCTKDYKIPGTEVVIPEGMIVKIPMYSLHHDERFWPEPEEFRPERFMPENKNEIRSGTFMPFGLGPRNCVGMRFALMESKVAIAKILLEFDLSCAPGQEELQLSRNPGAMRPTDDFSVVFTPLLQK